MNAKDTASIIEEAGGDTDNICGLRNHPLWSFDQIPQRPYLFGKTHIRGYVTATFAPSGTGKSMLALGEAIAMAAGRCIHFDVPAAPLRVGLINGEDPLDEIRRGAAAYGYRYGLPSAATSNLYIGSGRSPTLPVLALLKKSYRHSHAMDELASRLRDHLDVLIFDPFVSIHDAAENDNVAMNGVMRTLSQLAERAGVAIHIIHHSGKIDGREVTAEHGRGASSIAAACRLVRVLNRMTDAEAASKNLPSANSYFREDIVKANFQSLGREPRWYQIQALDMWDGRRGDDLIGIALPCFTSAQVPGMPAIIDPPKKQPFQVRRRSRA